jgi:hypothetical protein
MDNINMDLAETEWGVMGWNCLAQDREQCNAPVNTVMNPLGPQNFVKFFSNYATGGFSRSAQLHEVS